MQERIIEQKESLSAYMDGQQNVNVNFVEALTDSLELKQKWANYHTIRSVMQGDDIILGSDFSAKMEVLIENEKIESLSSQVTSSKQPKGLLLKLKRWSTPIMQASIAASVCLVAVFSVNSFNAKNEVAQIEQPVLKTLPFSHSIEAVSYNAPTHTQPTAEQLELQQHKIDALLENYELQRRTNNVKDATLTDSEKKNQKHH